MTKRSKSDDAASLIVRTRNRFFGGKFLGERELSREQEYFLSRHRLDHRLGLGWGVACGLGVEPHPNPSCSGWVVVRAGLAIDGWGREIVLDDDTAWEVPAEVDGPLLVCLRHVEQEAEPVPVLYDEDCRDPRQQEANWILETACLEACAAHEVEPGCWPGFGTAPAADEPSACLEPSVCGDRVPTKGDKRGIPLALLVPRTDSPGFDIDPRGRRLLTPPASALTRVVAVSWPHGGAMTFDDLRARDGRLEVRFERPLADDDGDPGRGVGPQTFVVRYGEGGGTSVPAAAPPTVEDGVLAVFRVDVDRLETHSTTVHVELDGDFILDQHGRPVDGNHLGGRLPSGNGTPGGTFRSWFRLGFEEDDS